MELYWSQVQTPAVPSADSGSDVEDLRCRNTETCRRMKSDSAQEVTLLKNTFYLRYFQHLVPKKAVLLLLPLTPVTPVPLACCWKGGIVGNFLAGWCDSVWRAPYLCGEEVSGSDNTSSLFVNLLSSTSISGSQRGTLRGPTGDPSSRPDGSEGLEDFQVPGKVPTEPRDTSRPQDFYSIKPIF